MSRNVFKQVMGSLDYRFHGLFVTTMGSTSYFYDLKRADVQKGAQDGDWIHPTSYWASRITEFAMVGEWKFTRFGGENHYKGVLTAVASGSYVPVGYSLIPFESKYLSRAIISAREQLLGDNAVNFLQNFAERQQAVNLITDRLTSIRKGYHYARKRKWKQAFRAIGLHKQKIARRLSENVLAWNYGVAPLADDIAKGIAQATGDDREDNFLKVVGKAGNGGGDHRQVVDDNGSNVPRLINYTERHFATCVMWVKPENETDIRLAANMVNNPFLLGYELIPYSFLLDWVYDVGGWLTAMGATKGWSFYSGYTMERTQCLSSYQSYASASNGTSDIQGGAFRECKQFRRERLTTFPIPGGPGFKNPFSLVHALNAIALFGART